MKIFIFCDKTNLESKLVDSIKEAIAVGKIQEKSGEKPLD
jgi:hypothetical protein